MYSTLTMARLSLLHPFAAQLRPAPLNRSRVQGLVISCILIFQQRLRVVVRIVYELVVALRRVLVSRKASELFTIHIFCNTGIISYNNSLIRVWWEMVFLASIVSCILYAWDLFALLICESCWASLEIFLRHRSSRLPAAFIGSKKDFRLLGEDIWESSSVWTLNCTYSRVFR